MQLFGLLKAALSFASFLTEYLKNKQLIEAGEAKAIAKGLENANETIDKARRARRNAVRNFDRTNGMCDEDDPNLRD